MINTKEARELLTANRFPIVEEEVSIKNAAGRILAETIYGERDAPPFDRVTMDGIAVLKSGIYDGAEFSKVSEQFAGMPGKKFEIQENECVETATGAVRPEGTDTIIPYEFLDRDGDVFTLKPDFTTKALAKTNIHYQGSDRKQGQQVLPKGTWLHAPEIAILASEGKSNCLVYRLPKVAVISTGDELVDIDTEPLPHQIRRSNAFLLQALLSEDGIESEAFHLEDDQEKISAFLKKDALNFDVLIFSGGVSMGKKDFLPVLLQAHGVECQFHKVAQRPGKPLWFGCNESLHVFGLPGNPVSSLVSYAVHFRFWLNQSLNIDRNITALLDTSLNFNPSLTRYLPVTTYLQDGRLMARPVNENGSGDFEALAGSSGVLELPAENTTFVAGQTFQFHPFHV